ncbi:MAG: tetratricopeptide repeat protein [Gemmataceae bacterium]
MKPWLQDKELNWKAVIILVVVTVGFGVGVYFVHGFQLRRNTAGLLDLVEEFDQRDETKKAIQYLQMYVQLVPSDTDAMAKLALRLCEMEKSPPSVQNQALLLLEQVLRRDHEPDEQWVQKLKTIRKNAAQISFRLRRFRVSKKHWEALLKEAPNDPNLLEPLAYCEVALGNYPRAVDLLVKAQKNAPQRLLLYVAEAAVHRDKLQNSKLADESIEDMVTANEPSKAELAKMQKANKEPKEAVLARLEAARYYARYDLLEEAKKHIDYARKTLKSTKPAVFLFSAALAERRSGKEEAKAFLLEGREHNPNNFQLQLALARLELTSGEPEEAKKLLQACVENRPKETEPLWSLAVLLLDARETDQLPLVMKDLGDVATPEAEAFVKARLLINQEEWREAQTELARVVNRPVSKRLSKLLNFWLAKCYGKLGNPDQQLAALEKAIEDDPQWIAARIDKAATLAKLGKLDRAMEEYQRVGEVPKVKLARLDLMLAQNARNLQSDSNWQQDFEKNYKLLPDEEKKSHAGQVLWGRYLTAKGKLSEARSMFEKLRKDEKLPKDDPKRVELWALSIGLAVREGKAETVEGLLKQAEGETGWQPEWDLFRVSQWFRRVSEDSKNAEEKLKDAREKLNTLIKQRENQPIADRNRLFRPLGLFLVNVGEYETAGKLWKKVAETSPDELGLWTSLFDLAVRTKDFEAGRESLKEIRRLEGEAGAWTAYGNAVLLIDSASREGKKDSLIEAKQWVDKLAKIRPSWSRVGLLRANIYELEGKTDLALKEYQSVVKSGNKNPQLVFRMLQIYGTAGGIDVAQSELFPLVNMERNPGYMLIYIRSLLLQNDLFEASRWLKKLKSLVPNSVATIELEVRLLKGRGNTRKAIQLVQKYLRSEKARLVYAARLYEILEKDDEAEMLLRQYVSKSRIPEYKLVLATFLGRRGKVDEPLSICRNAWESCKAKSVVRAIAAIVERPEIRDAHPRKVETWLVEEIKRKPNIPTLRSLLAGFYDKRGEFQKSLELYRSVVKENPKDVLARNNLAYQLSLQNKDLDEALQLANDAIKLVGPKAELLDTRALVYIQRKEFKKAKKDLEIGLRQNPNASWLLFHFAVAELRDGNSLQASLRFAQAKEKGLKREELHPLERPMFDQLVKSGRFK